MDSLLIKALLGSSIVRISNNLMQTYVPVKRPKCPHELRRGVHMFSGALSTSTPARCPHETGADSIPGITVTNRRKVSRLARKT